jgi:hypothetical protein
LLADALEDCGKRSVLSNSGMEALFGICVLHGAVEARCSCGNTQTCASNVGNDSRLRCLSILPPPVKRIS